MSKPIDFKLYLVSDRKLVPEVFLQTKIEECLKHGIKAVQLREKDLLSKDLFQLASDLRNLTSQYGAKLFINDRVDIAMAVKANGVHCPEDALPIPTAKKHLGETLIGGSTHSLKRALQAEEEGADFILFGPIFSTPSKDGIIEPRGLEVLGKVAAAVKIPVFAIGGITPDRVKMCIDHGASGVGVISAILKSNNIGQTMDAFKKELGSL